MPVSPPSWVIDPTVKMGCWGSQVQFLSPRPRTPPIRQGRVGEMGFILSLRSYGNDLLSSDSHLVEYLQNKPLSLSVRNTRVSPETTEIIEKLLSPLDVWHLQCWTRACSFSGAFLRGENLNSMNCLSSSFDHVAMRSPSSPV